MNERAAEHGPEQPTVREKAAETPDVEPVKRPRAVFRKAEASMKPLRELSHFGAVPARATHWSLRRQKPAGTWEVCEHPTEDGSILLREWSLDDLDVETIRERHGAGRYKVFWVGTSDNGGRVPVGQGREFTVPELVAPAPVAAPAAPVGPSGFETAFALLDAIERRATSQLSAMAQLAGLGRGNNDATMALFAQLIDKQGQQTAALIQQLADGQRALERRIEQLASEEYEEEEESVVGAVARAAVPGLVKPGKPVGDAVKAAIANYFIEDPSRAVGQIVALASSVPGAIDALNKATAAKAAQQAPPASVQRPRVNVRPQPPAPVADEPMAPGLNTMAAEEKQQPAAAE